MLPGETAGGEGSKCFECNTALELQVCQSAAGYWLGYWCDEHGPCGRETGYFPKEETATKALERFQDDGVLMRQRR